MFFVRLFGWMFGIGAFMALVVAGVLAVYLGSMNEGLPDYTQLKKYEPPVMTRVHAADGQLVAEYARERRLFLPIQLIPENVKEAFLSAEDKTFYQHPGLDVFGIASAVVKNVDNAMSGRGGLVGASTITQQVAKNFLLTNERSLERKVKEALLSLRIEQAFSKDQILELYLNEIYLGLGAYGVAAASLTYFDKPLAELDLAQVAYLAALPKAPNNYHPYRYTDAAIERRNWVLDQMVLNGHATGEEVAEAKAAPLGVMTRDRTAGVFAADYFAEEVRRNLLDLYGEKGLYEGGLSVRTTLDPKMQVMARAALHRGLMKFDQARGWRGPVTTIPLDGEWAPKLAELPGLSDVPEWRLAVVLEASGDTASIGLQSPKSVTGEVAASERGVLPLSEMSWAKWATGERRGRAIDSVDDVLAPGDVIYVEKLGEGASGTGTYRLRQVPEVSGSLVAMDPTTGRVKALVGGFSFAQSEFNRATQALRQPGSSFKPFIYSAALDNGYTPASVILDAPVEVDQGPGLGMWRPQNYGGGFAGPSTLRTGIERSRNLMTVRLAQDMGMPLVAEYAERFGIYDQMQPVLSMALGAGETTVLRLVNAYSIIANGGRRVQPTLIDRVQDRFGRTIYKHDQRICEGCNAQTWLGQDEPTLIDEREQVLDPMTAYQITSMMEGVVKRGTATVVSALGRPVAGKTGTTNDEKDVWFVGFTPDLTVGVFMGYDQPKPMGRGSTGGQLAAPLFKEFLEVALAGEPPVEFRVPDGMSLIPIDRQTGMRSMGGEGTIIEAFKPGTGPADFYQVIGEPFAFDGATTVNPDADRAAVSGTGGLY